MTRATVWKQKRRLLAALFGAAIPVLGACDTTLSVLIPRDAGTNDAAIDTPDAAPSPVDGETSPVDAGMLVDAEAPATDAEMPADAEAGADSSLAERGAMLATFEHTCAVRAGNVYCWGRNDDAQLGLGDTQTRLLPTQVPALHDVVSLCAGEAHTCALVADGSLSCWGANIHGALGTDDRSAASRPGPVIGDLRFTAVACGGFVTCAIDATGQLFCWGENFEGQTGQGSAADTRDVLRPMPVLSTRLFRSVSVGQGHVCAVDSTGGLWCWGRNTEGQLGLGSTLEQVRDPSQVGANRDFRGVSAAQAHTCAIRRDGTLSCWGSAVFGKLGNGDLSNAVSTAPVALGDVRSVYGIASSWFHTCALHQEGALSCFGRNAEGQLGLGDASDRPLAASVAGAWDDVALGRFHTCARLGDGISCWGENAEGQLGLGDTDRRNLPAAVTFAP